MSGFHSRWVPALLAMTSVLLGASASQDSGKPDWSARARAAIARTEGTSDVITEKPPEIIVQPLSKHACLRGIEARIFLLRPTRQDIDEAMRKAIESALGPRQYNPVLWVRLSLDVNEALLAVREREPNMVSLRKEDFCGLTPTGKKTPVASDGRVTDDEQGRILRQDLAFAIPGFAWDMEVVVGPVSLAKLPLSQSNGVLEVVARNEFFPRVKSAGRYAPTLSSIVFYAKSRDLRPLDPNHVRFFNQPMGTISEAVDIDLVTGKLILYPGTHDTGTLRETIIDANDLRRLRETLASDAFRRIPEQGSRFGMDGYSYFIEVGMDGSYAWKFHWAPEDEDFKNVVHLIKSVSSHAWIVSWAKNRGIQPLAANRVRLFEPTGPGPEYQVIEIDLTTGSLSRRDGAGVRSGIVDSTSLAQIKEMLASDEFRRMSAQAREASADGTARLVEVNMNGSYLYKAFSVYGRGDFGDTLTQKLKGSSSR